jgi:hypothetical protein
MPLEGEPVMTCLRDHSAQRRTDLATEVSAQENLSASAHKAASASLAANWG